MWGDHIFEKVKNDVDLCKLLVYHNKSRRE